MSLNKSKRNSQAWFLAKKSNKYYPKRVVFYFIVMSTETPFEWNDFQHPAKETLTEAQKAVLERVLAILKDDHELQRSIEQVFRQNLMAIEDNHTQYTILFDKLQSVEMIKLWEIQDRFSKNKINDAQAIKESKEIIIHYTRTQLQLLRTTGDMPSYGQ
jgi:hypothetical protein